MARKFPHSGEGKLLQTPFTLRYLGPNDPQRQLHLFIPFLHRDNPCDLNGTAWARPSKWSLQQFAFTAIYTATCVAYAHRAVFTCYRAEVIFPPLPISQLRPTLDLATPESCKAELT